MTFLTRPFLTFVFALEPVWISVLAVDLVMILVLIFIERFTPRTLIFWISVVVVVPFLGVLLYMLFGNGIYSSRVFGRKQRRDEDLLGGSMDALPDDISTSAVAIRGLGGDICTIGNHTRFYWEYHQMVGDMVADIAAANHSIHIMAYRLPGVHDAIYETIKERALAGIEVCIMTSTLGFGRTSGIRELKVAGVRFCTFHRAVYSALSIRPAMRNMRSITVIDGRIAYQGRGACVRIEGAAANRLERRFLVDWRHGSGEGVESPVAAPITVPGGIPVQVVSSGPDLGEAMPMTSCYTSIIKFSRRTLYMTFPYLLPNDEIYAAVKLAVASGVDVRILLPRNGRHWYQSWNSLAASNPLMMMGTKVYFADRVLEKCVIVSDGKLCCVGSGDFSSRPLAQDFNICCLIYSLEEAARAEASFLEELEGAVECLPEEYSRRSVGDILRIGVARLLMFFN